MNERTDVGRVDGRTIYDGRIFRLDVDRVRFPDGSTGELEMIRHPGAAAVVPMLGSIDEPDPELILIRQYRYAAEGYLLEVPAGRRNRAGEDWEECARRELEEETGYRAGRLLPMTDILTTPGFTDERIRLFLALELSDGNTARDEDEFIELERIRLSDALEAIRSGDIVDAKTICALLYAATFVLSGGATTRR